MKYLYSLLWFLVLFLLPFFALIVTSYIFDFKLRDTIVAIQVLIPIIAFMFGVTGGLIYLEKSGR